MSKTVRIKAELPAFLPQGWKIKVAERLGVHRNTVGRAIKEGNGQTYNKVVKCAAELFGTQTVKESN